MAKCPHCAGTDYAHGEGEPCAWEWFEQQRWEDEQRAHEQHLYEEQYYREHPHG